MGDGLKVAVGVAVAVRECVAAVADLLVERAAAVEPAGFTADLTAADPAVFEDGVVRLNPAGLA